MNEYEKDFKELNRSILQAVSKFYEKYPIKSITIDPVLVSYMACGFGEREQLSHFEIEVVMSNSINTAKNIK